MPLTEQQIADIRGAVVARIVELAETRGVVSIKLMSFDVENSFDSMRDNMARIEEDYPEYKSFEFRQHGDGYGDERYIYVYGVREETDDEMIARACEKAERDALREQRERADFERLSAKFG
ncbi:MAG: hypothetical protein EOO77_24090 [Oxalobacteraceae bacterium]|nr:MAG: hypothetical protein EOO77_24090 [Oxalobacteraceae bacterium]